MIVNPDDGTLVHHVRTRTISKWQSGHGHVVEEWCEWHIGPRGNRWDIAFGRFMFLDENDAVFFRLTWQD